MDLSLAGRAALVTGATAGIGRATAASLLAEGVDVALSARRREDLEAVAHDLADAGPGRTVVVPGDLETTDGPAAVVAGALAALGRLDVLVANGAPTPMGSLDAFDDEGYARTLDGKPLAYVRMARAAADALADGGGVIVMIAGISARSVGHRYLMGTAATAAIHGMTRVLSDELAPRGVRVVTVDPGLTDTRRFRDVLPDMAARQGRTVDELVDELAAAIPVGRIADPADVADVITFLASDRARHVTGTSVLVDGGASRAVD